MGEQKSNKPKINFNINTPKPVSRHSHAGGNLLNHWIPNQVGYDKRLLMHQLVHFHNRQQDCHGQRAYSYRHTHHQHRLHNREQAFDIA